MSHLPEYADVLAANTPADLFRLAERLTNELEYDYFGLFVAIDHHAGPTTFHPIYKTPPAYEEIYLDPTGFKADPVAQHCKRNSVPIIWDESTYRKADVMELYAPMEANGYRHGLAAALHLPFGRHLMFGIDRAKAADKDIESVTRAVAATQLFAVHVADACLRILTPQASAEEEPRLTARELEVLRWTMEGKTAWEIGRVLSISERTTSGYAVSAMRKLDCISKHQAVVKALRMGLIR